MAWLRGWPGMMPWKSKPAVGEGNLHPHHDSCLFTCPPARLGQLSCLPLFLFPCQYAQLPTLPSPSGWLSWKGFLSPPSRRNIVSCVTLIQSRTSLGLNFFAYKTKLIIPSFACPPLPGLLWEWNEMKMVTYWTSAKDTQVFNVSVETKYIIILSWFLISLCSW